MQTVSTDRPGLEPMSSRPRGLDWSRLVAWLVVDVVALGFWAGVGLLVALLV